MTSDELESHPKPAAKKPSAPETPAAPGGPVAPQRKGHGIWWLLLIVLGVAFIGYRIYQSRQLATAAATKNSDRAALPVPVVAGTVQKKDVPIYLDGIGTVQALNTVTVTPRVDGEVKRVAFTEGQEVKEGDLLAEIDEAPFRAAYDQAVAKKGQDEAQLANAQLNLTRDIDLFAKKAISTQERDTQQALVNQLDAAVKADAAAIASAKVQLDYTKILAPISGRTGVRLIDEGNIVHAADRTGIVVLTQLHPISVVFTLPEQSLTSIDKDTTKTETKVFALDRDNKTTLDEGKLSVIDNQIDITTGTIKLKATFPNEKLQLWPGQFINARLLLTIHKDGLVVPASVVQRGPQGSFAFVINSDDSVEARPVKVGQIERAEALIESGLQAGERVVVDGQYKLQPGSKVNTAAPSAGPGAGPGGPGGGAHGGGKPGGAGAGQHAAPK